MNTEAKREGSQPFSSKFSDNAPIAFFAYKRPEHTLKSLEALNKNHSADRAVLYIFCDGPKGNEDWKGVEAVRKIAKMKRWCKEVNIIERDSNLGLANSIMNGVTDLINEHGTVIVIEDDLIVSPVFLDFMTESLKRYRDEPEVMQVSGHIFPIIRSFSNGAFFLPMTTSWGWATWQRAWAHFDPSMSGAEKVLADWNYRVKFDLDGAYPYADMLEAQLNGRIDSWAIRWYLSMFLRSALTLYPPANLVKNIGLDGSGTHCGNSKILGEGDLCSETILNFPTRIAIDEDAFRKTLMHLREQNNISKASWLRRIRYEIKRIVYGETNPPILM